MGRTFGPNNPNNLGVPGNRIGSGGNYQFPAISGAGGAGTNGPNVNVYDTLTPDQHALVQGMMANIQAQGVNNPLGRQDVNSALSNALTSNPSAMLNATATANYINKSVATPLLREYENSIAPRIKDSYASVGALMGSRRADAQQKALEGLQTTLAGEMAKAQLANQQQAAQLAEQTASRQGQVANQFIGQQQQNALGYNQLGSNLTGQSWMALLPWMSGTGSFLPGGFGGGASGFGGMSMPTNFGVGAAGSPASGGFFTGGGGPMSGQTAAFAGGSSTVVDPSQVFGMGPLSPLPYKRG